MVHAGLKFSTSRGMKEGRGKKSGGNLGLGWVGFGFLKFSYHLPRLAHPARLDLHHLILHWMH